MADILLGQVIRGYRIEARIGAGGFGVVYRALQESTNRLVAIKVIFPEYTAIPGFLERFRQEAHLVARLEHPHIVPLIDSWVMPDNAAYLAMRYFPAGSLRDILNHKKPMDVESVVRIASQVADALSLAHMRGVIHRDLKPDNILLDDQQNAFLTDFGIAKDLTTNTNITTQGAPPLSPRYAAPEQFGGAVGPQTDLYSLALTMYECLTGKYPFPDTPMMRFAMPMPMPPTPLHPALYSVFLQATQPNPLARQASVLAFADDLGRASAATLPVPPPVPLPDDADTKVDYRAITPRSSQTESTDKSQPNPTPPSNVRVAPVSALVLYKASHITWRPQKLIGRDSLLANLIKRLQANDHVLLQGLSGTGKTALAAECAARFLSDGRVPVLWIEVSDATAGSVQEALARPFGAHELLRKSATETERQQYLRELFTEKQMSLIVLDNVWCEGKVLKHLISSIPTDIPVLVTSQQNYPLGRIERAEMLEPIDALTLLRFYSELDLTDQEADAIQLCQQLDCHPFALEIAGKTLSIDHITPITLLQRMATDPHTIVMPSGYAEEGRQSVKELLDTSIGRLPSAIRNVFLACGAFFTPSITPDLLGLALGQHPEETNVSLQNLLRRGILNAAPSEDRIIYRLHSLSFAYARANATLTSAQGVAACRRYAKHFEDNSAAIAAERINLLQAASMSARLGDNESLVAILKSLTVDGSYLRERGHDQILLDQLSAAVNAARKDGESETLQALVGKLGNLYSERGEFDQAARCYQEYIEIAQAQTNRIREVRALAILSNVYTDMGNYSEAEKCLAIAESHANALNDLSIFMTITENRGYLAVAQGELDKARFHFEINLQQANEANDVHQKLRALTNLGGVLHDKGNYSEALDKFKQALHIQETQLESDKSWQSQLLLSMAMSLHEMKGSSEDIQNMLRKALKTKKETGNMLKVREIEVYMRKHNYQFQD